MINFYYLILWPWILLWDTKSIRLFDIYEYQFKDFLFSSFVFLFLWFLFLVAAASRVEFEMTDLNCNFKLRYDFRIWFSDFHQSPMAALIRIGFLGRIFFLLRCVYLLGTWKSTFFFFVVVVVVGHFLRCTLFVLWTCHLAIYKDTNACLFHNLISNHQFLNFFNPNKNLCKID